MATAKSSVELIVRVEKLEAELADARRKAVAVALLAALVGSGGAVGLVQYIGGARLRDAESALKEQALRINEQQAVQAQRSHEVELKLKEIAENREAFELNYKKFQATIDASEKTAAATRRAGGSSATLSSLLSIQIQQADAFIRYLSMSLQYGSRDVAPAIQKAQQDALAMVTEARKRLVAEQSSLVKGGKVR